VPLALTLAGAPDRRRASGAVLVLRGAARADLEATVLLTATLAEHSILVAVDGGLATCRACRRPPDLFVGDVDSTRCVPARTPSIVYRRDKDHSDLAGALQEMRRRAVSVVGIAGLLGGRIDHEWANLLEVGKRARSFAAIVARAERATLIITAQGCRVKLPRGAIFSLLALTGSACVTLAGARWTLRRERLTPGSRGLSNVAAGHVALAVHAGTVALLAPRS
jgi:thiamine pyrophosphokinase